MGRCESCGKRDRAAAHHCWDCERTHWRDECVSPYFNDALSWCWCGSPNGGAATSLAGVVQWLDHYRHTDE